METIFDLTAAAGIAGAEAEAAVLAAAALIVIRWLWLGIRADWKRWRTPRAAYRGPSGAHAEAFDRGMQRLLAEREQRAGAELAAFRHAA